MIKELWHIRSHWLNQDLGIKGIKSYSSIKSAKVILFPFLLFWNLLNLTKLNNLQGTIIQERETHTGISRSMAEAVRMERALLRVARIGNRAEW